MTDDLLAEQIDYYRARAARYDDWWFRRGKFDLGEEYSRRWWADVDRVRQSVDEFAPAGDVLELAGGTGNWTLELAPRVERLTVVDSSPETIAISRGKLDALTPADVARVEYVESDVFAWAPDRRYDVVFFSFWLSHVPYDRFDEFWTLVDAALAPDGRVLFIDNAHPRLAAERGPQTGLHHLLDERQAAGIDSVTDLVTGEARRRLDDGREYRLVKVFWEAEALRARLAQIGWAVDVTTTDWAFLVGRGGRAR